jgi:hypothetical protein
MMWTMTPVDQPVLLFLLSILVLWAAARLGVWLRNRRPALQEKERDDVSVILGATLTLLGLIIGFSFSMAISRYDQRKNYEESEANAIGTEYLRADLLPADDAAKVRALLVKYLDQRILFYQTTRSGHLDEINTTTAQLQSDLWSAIRPAAAAQPTPIVGLAVSGMNDVLNAQGYTQASWWNRIPFAAWCLMFQIAIFGNILLGYYLQDPLHAPRTRNTLFLILPLILSISFLLIADIDSPRGGFIHVTPQNLISVSRSLH